MVANTTYENVLSSYQSVFMDKYPIPEGLEFQWFLDANAEYALEIKDLEFDEELMEYPTQLPQKVVLTLASIMKSKYSEREFSRVNKLNNIIGKDISLNGMGDSKRFAERELEIKRSQIADLINKQKTTAYD